MLDRTAPLTQSVDIAAHFVRLLTGSSDHIMRLRFIHDSDRSKSPTAEREGAIRQLWPEIIEYQRQGYGIFYFMNECANGHGSGRGGCAEDVDVKDVCRVLATDHDEGLPDTWHRQPAIVVHTSRVLINGKDVKKGQALWPVRDLSKSEFKSTQLRLAAYYGTDTSISNPSRVLRLPGTLHLKIPVNPQLVTLEDFTEAKDLWEYLSAPADVLAGLPPLQERKSGTPSEMHAPVSSSHLRTLLSYLDADAPRPDWLVIIAAIRATPVARDEDDSERRKIALEFSRGALDRFNRFKNAPPSRYTDDDAVNQVFDTMPPRMDGVAFGTIYHAAKSAGYAGPPNAQSVAAVFGDCAYVADAIDVKSEAASNQRLPSPIPFLLTEADIFAWPDPEELVAGFIMCGENVCLFGQPKVGKTFIALDLALSIAANLPVFGRLSVRKTGAVVYLSGEGHAGMKRRIKAWRQARSIPTSTPLPFYYKASVPNTVAGAEECKRYIDGISSQLGGPPVLIVIDTMARSMTGLNENDAGDVGRYLALTEGLRAGLNCPVLTLAHSGKDETKGIRGSNASTAGFDAIWSAEMNDANKTVKIESRWLKDAEELGPFCFRLRHVSVDGMTNGKGAVLEYVPLDEFRKAADEHDPLARTKVYAALTTLGAADRDHGITSTALLNTLFPRRETETEEGREAFIRGAGKNLSHRASDRCRASLSLKIYAHKGEGPGKATFWYLPATARDDADAVSMST